MSPTPDDRPPPAYGPGDQPRHDLKSALTTIHARAQLLGRAVRRAPSVGHVANAHPAPPRARDNAATRCPSSRFVGGYITGVALGILRSGVAPGSVLNGSTTATRSTLSGRTVPSVSSTCATISCSPTGSGATITW
jgi:hypothetical protein